MISPGEVAALQVAITVLAGAVGAGGAWATMQAENKARKAENEAIRAEAANNRAAMTAIRQVLGFEAVNGEIHGAFPTHEQCAEREGRSNARLGEAERKLDNHEHRISTLEGRAHA